MSVELNMTVSGYRRIEKNEVVMNTESLKDYQKSCKSYLRLSNMILLASI